VRRACAGFSTMAGEKCDFAALGFVRPVGCRNVLMCYFSSLEWSLLDNALRGATAAAVFCVSCVACAQPPV
jgi:hypothetical protein